MGTLVIDGSITAGPASTGDNEFPSAQASIFLSANKQLIGCTGVIARNFNSPSSYVALPGVGATDAVTKADTLYVRSDSPILLRLTMKDPAGGSDIVSILTHQGTCIHEFPQTGTLVLLEAKGTAKIEYLIGGLL